MYIEQNVDVTLYSQVSFKSRLMYILPTLKLYAATKSYSQTEKRKYQNHYEKF